MALLASFYFCAVDTLQAFGSKIYARTLIKSLKERSKNWILTRHFVSFLPALATRSMLLLPGVTYQEYRLTKLSKAPGGNVCLVCGIHISSSTNMRRHFEERHQVSDLRYYCPACNLEFLRKRSLQGHISYMHPTLKGMDLSNCTFRDPLKE